MPVRQQRIKGRHLDLGDRVRARRVLMQLHGHSRIFNVGQSIDFRWCDKLTIPSARMRFWTLPRLIAPETDNPFLPASTPSPSLAECSGHLVSDPHPDRFNAAALTAIKIAHTIVWALFVACIFGIPLAAWHGQFHASACLTLVVAGEVLVLAANGWRCPMTSMAKRFTNEHRDNFDIYLPLWLAKHNKVIFGALYVAGVIFAISRWIQIPG